MSYCGRIDFDQVKGLIKSISFFVSLFSSHLDNYLVKNEKF